MVPYSKNFGNFGVNLTEQKFRELQVLARGEGRNTQELLTLYVLEGFLSRVAESPYTELLVLKGGVLLAALDNRRPTRDIDFAGIDMNNEAENVLKVCCEIASNFQVDGIVFDIGTATARIIRDEDEYSGARVSMSASIHTAQISFHIDVNVGDPIVPGVERVTIPRLLDSSNPIVLLGYPISMVLAEKIVTAIQRGTANTRWRDFGDIYELSRLHSFPYSELKTSVNAVAEHRLVEMTTLREGLAGFAEIGQIKYENWRRKQDRHELPETFADLLEEIYAFSDEVIDGREETNAYWNPSTLMWE